MLSRETGDLVLYDVALGFPCPSQMPSRGALKDGAFRHRAAGRR